MVVRLGEDRLQLYEPWLRLILDGAGGALARTRCCRLRAEDQAGIGAGCAWAGQEVGKANVLVTN